MIANAPATLAIATPLLLMAAAYIWVRWRFGPVSFASREKSPPPEIGPDGMSDFCRELHARWARRDAYIAQINAALTDRGYDPDVLMDMRDDQIFAALILGVKPE